MERLACSWSNVKCRDGSSSSTTRSARLCFVICRHTDEHATMQHRASDVHLSGMLCLRSAHVTEHRGAGAEHEERSAPGPCSLGKPDGRKSSPPSCPPPAAGIRTPPSPVRTCIPTIQMYRPHTRAHARRLGRGGAGRAVGQAGARPSPWGCLARDQHCLTECTRVLALPPSHRPRTGPLFYTWDAAGSPACPPAPVDRWACCGAVLMAGFACKRGRALADRASGSTTHRRSRRDWQRRG